MKDSEVIEGAIERLDRKGWCQGKAENSAGSVCMSEALAEALLGVDSLHTLGAVPFGDGAAKQWRRVVARLGLGVSVPMWNDCPERTADQVRDHLMTTAKGLRDEGQ